MTLNDVALAEGGIARSAHHGNQPTLGGKGEAEWARPGTATPTKIDRPTRLDCRAIAREQRAVCSGGLVVEVVAAVLLNSGLSPSKVYRSRR